MTELDDPVRLVKKGNPLAQRPVLAVGVLCGVLLIVAHRDGSARVPATRTKMRPTRART